MMSALLCGGSSKLEVVGYDTSATTGTVITANGSAGSDGAWTQLVAATANDWYSFWAVLHYGASTVASYGLVDIGIGGAGSEIAIVSSLPIGHRAAIVQSMSYRIWLALHIPKGTRVSARVHRSALASLPTRIFLVGETPAIRYMPCFSRCTTYGEDLTNKRGTVMNPGTVANTLGSNVQIASSTTNPIRALYLLATKQDAGTVTAARAQAMEIYVGGAGSEVVLIPEVSLWEENDTLDFVDGYGCGIGPFFVDVPAGSRLSAKARCSDAQSTEREGQLLLLGLD